MTQTHTTTRFTRRGVLQAGGLMLAGSTLAACATSPQAPIGNDQPITLVEAFRGERTGRGLFSVPLAGVERGFDARLVGTVGGNTLTVVEDFIFDDGEVQQLTWVFTRTGPFEWSGVRDDTVGTATVVETGTDIRLDYVADVVSRGETTRLGFSDIIYREPGNVIINEAVVTRFGIPIGTVRFEIRQT